MQYKLKSTLEDVHKFEIELEKRLSEVKINKKSLFNIRLAFHEAVINVIQHTYNFQKDKDVLIDINISGEVFECEIRDFGNKVNPEDIRPKKKENTIQTNGLGVFLYSKLMDEVEFSNTNDGNLITLKKYFSSSDF
jgi:anti-sigma regulatory factor (Ser/Thr protein kinase)